MNDLIEHNSRLMIAEMRDADDAHDNDWASLFRHMDEDDAPLFI